MTRTSIPPEIQARIDEVQTELMGMDRAELTGRLAYLLVEHEHQIKFGREVTKMLITLQNHVGMHYDLIGLARQKAIELELALTAVQTGQPSRMH